MEALTDKENDQDGYVITEEHYTRFLASFSSAKKSTLVPPDIALMMRDSRFLFLGYSLRDWNLRVLLETVSRVDRPRSWAVQADPDIVEKKIWSTKDVGVYGVNLRDFVKELETCYFDGKR